MKTTKISSAEEDRPEELETTTEVSEDDEEYTTHPRDRIKQWRQRQVWQRA